MHFAAAFLVVGTLWTVNSEIHSLNYIYTALSKPVDLPGIHEFTAMGLLDNRMIDYYDSSKQEKIPKQRWMEEKLDKDYWDKGTQSRKSKEQWFKVNVGILMERMRQNSSDVHVLQWRHGCEIERHSDGKETFVQGFDEYRYDGEDFLAFNDKDMQWTAPNLYAVPTKRKWDGVEILNRYTKGYLEKECVEWLNKFETYSTDYLGKQTAVKPPEVHMYAKKCPRTEGNLQLTCWATGFLPKEITMVIRKNEVPVTKGVDESGVRPNHDNTYQLWKRIAIPEGDNKADYDCHVQHLALKEPLIKKWDHTCADCNTLTWGVVGVIIGILISVLVVALVCGILYQRRCMTLTCSPATPLPSPTPSLEKIPLTIPDTTSSDSGNRSNFPGNTVTTNGTTAINMGDCTSDSEKPLLKQEDSDSGKGSHSSDSSERSN